MFSKLALLAAASMVVFVAAAPGVAPPTTYNIIENSCNSGAVQCCDQQFDSNSDETSLLAGIVGADIAPITAQAGVTCTPVTGIGASGTSCSTQPVCCEDNNFYGFVAFGCNPVNANL